MFELIWSAAREVRHVGWDPKARLFAGGALFAVVGGIYIARQAMKLHRQTKYPLLIDPTEAPDFSPLADGSERWKKLEDV